MPIEIERKFLITGDDWRGLGQGTHYRQGYLSVEPGRSVRVRLAGDGAWLTIKGRTEGMARAEYEYPIPAAEAAEMLDTLCIQPLIEKVRYRIEHAGHTWEVDEFSGDNAGLVLAEVELAAPDEAVELPAWIGREVTDDARYYNASLQLHPYREWGGQEEG
jgi:adenylate cyclase